MKQITDKIYYVGVNDRQKALFENLWPLPKGVSYNSYLILDEKTVLIDTVDVCYSDVFFKKVNKLLQGRPLDYLIINHMEPDHAGSIRLLRHLYPNVQIIGNKVTFGMLSGFHGITDGLYEVKEGDHIDLGTKRITFFMAPLVHWPEVMFTYEETGQLLFSADAFGTYGTLDGGVMDYEMDIEHFWGEMERYYSNVVGKYGAPIQKALKKLSNLPVEYICPAHGPVWHDHKDKTMSVFNRFSQYEGDEGAVILYGSMYGHTEQMAEEIARSLSEQGIQKIVLHHASKSHASYVLRDIFKYRGLIVGSPTYNGHLFPDVSAILKDVEINQIKNRLFGYFGSYTWAPAAVKKLAEFGESMKWEIVGESVEQKQALDTDEQCAALGKAMGERLKQTNQ